MLSPPNGGSELADHLMTGPLRHFYRLTTGPAGQELGTSPESTPNQLGPVNFPLGVITGNRSLNPLFSSTFPGANDGKVAVERAKVEGMADFLVVRHSHSFIMRSSVVTRETIHFPQARPLFHHRSMNLFNAIAVGLKEIWAHKFRSILTMLGIILGVSSLVAMSALVKGMENGMREALVAIGGLEKIRIEQQDIPSAQQHLADQAVGLTVHDLHALKASAPKVTQVAPEMRARNLRVTKGGKTTEWANVIGTWPSSIDINQHVIEHGRMFNEVDDDFTRNVCVIGTNIRDQLFGDEEEQGRPPIIPIGETISIGGEPFVVVGMFERYESETEKKRRAFERSQPKTEQSGPARSRGWGGRGRGGDFVFRMKNSTIYIPLNTMYLKFKSATGTNSIPDPRLDVINMRIGSINELEPSLQQAKNVSDAHAQGHRRLSPS